MYSEVIAYWCEECQLWRKSPHHAHATPDAKDARMENGRWNMPYNDGFDGLGLCPRCHGAETRNGTLCRVCRDEEQADRG